MDEAVIPANTVTHNYTKFGAEFFTDPVKICQNIYQVSAPEGTAFFTMRAEDDTLTAGKLIGEASNSENKDFTKHLNKEWQDLEYPKRFLIQGEFDPKKINVVQKDCFMKAASVKELSLTVTDVCTGLIRPKGWSSEDEKSKWVEALCENLMQRPHFEDSGEKGVGIRMVVHFASGTK